MFIARATPRSSSVRLALKTFGESVAEVSGVFTTQQGTLHSFSSGMLRSTKFLESLKLDAGLDLHVEQKLENQSLPAALEGTVQF